MQDALQRGRGIPLGFFLLLTAYFVSAEAAIFLAADERPTIIVGACGVGVALYFGHMQWRLGEEMRRLSAEQRRLSEAMRLLMFAPVLRPEFSHEYDAAGSVIHLSNIGKGPAMDIHACLWTKREEDLVTWFHVPATTQTDHLGPEEDRLTVYALECGDVGRPVRGFQRQTTDVWIVHCGDQNGVHWHAWSNWSREKNEHSAVGRFFFERVFRTPRWVIEHCQRCKQLREESLQQTQCRH